MTKIVVVGLEGAAMEHFLGDDRLVNFRRVAEGGSFGPLAGVEASSASSWIAFAKSFAFPGVDYQYIDWSKSGAADELVDAYCLRLDHDLSSFLQTLTNEAILLIVSIAADLGQGAFILSADCLPISGELASASIADLPPTLLALAGIEIPATMQGRSLISGHTVAKIDGGELSDDARQLLLDRLSGLGYI